MGFALPRRVEGGRGLTARFRCIPKLLVNELDYQGGGWEKGGWTQRK